MTNMYSFQREIPINQKTYDLIVVEDAPAGCAAAVEAARQGVQVLLVKATGALGGMGTSGLVNAFDPMADGEKNLVAGFMKELVEELYKRGELGPYVTPERFINSSLLKKMKPSAFLVNTSRGNLVNEEDLAEALQAGCLAGAGLDVLSSEPPKKTNVLLKTKNCFITPHLTWSSVEAKNNLMNTALENLKVFTQKQLSNRVD